MKNSTKNKLAVFLFSALVVSLGISYAHADEDVKVDPTFELATPNDLSGQVILSFTDCDLKLDVPVSDKLYNARAVVFAGTDQEKVYRGCWYYSAPPANVPNSFPVVNIFTEDGQLFTAPASDFKPYKPVSPEV